MRINGQWWFAAREGDMGPYASREEALKQMETFIASQQFIEETDTESKPAPKKKSTFQGDTTIWDRQIDST